MPAFPLVRNRSRLAVGLIVILLSALAASSFYGKAGDRQSVLVLARTVEQGHVISLADLGRSDVATDTNVRVVAASKERSIVGQVATTRLLQGSLLSTESTSTKPALEAGRSTVGAALKVGQYPADMRVGDPVLLITPAAQDGTINGQQKQGVVATFQAPSRDSGTASASFVVDQSDAATLATAGADGKLAIVVLPR